VVVAVPLLLLLLPLPLLQEQCVSGVQHQQLTANAGDPAFQMGSP
jgi:hypothetical protein